MILTKSLPCIEYTSITLLISTNEPEHRFYVKEDGITYFHTPNRDDIRRGKGPDTVGFLLYWGPLSVPFLSSRFCNLFTGLPQETQSPDFPDISRGGNLKVTHSVMPGKTHIRSYLSCDSGCCLPFG